MLGQEASHCARQNYIRPDPNEPDLPAWVHKQIQGPLTRKQQKVLLGHGFPGLFSNIFVCVCVCGPECVCIEHVSWLDHACMCVPAKLFSVNGRVLHQGQGELLTGTLYLCIAV